MAINDVKKIPDLLSDEQLQSAIVSIVSSFDTEVTRYVDEKHSLHIVDVFMSLHYSTDMFSFFVARNLDELGKQFFTSVPLRRFILNLTERVSIDMSSTDMSYNDTFLNTLTESIVRNKPHSETDTAWINKEVLESLYINPDVLKTLLRNNFWVAILYLLLMNFHQTTVFKSLRANKT